MPGRASSGHWPVDLGDRDTAHLEVDAARRIFEELGAAPDLARLKALFPTAAPPPAGNLTTREIEVLALVAEVRPTARSLRS
jgi:hypothetical protein